MILKQDHATKGKRTGEIGWGTEKERRRALRRMRRKESLIRCWEKGIKIEQQVVHVLDMMRW